MKKNFDWLRVSGHHHKLRNAAIERLRRCAVMAGLRFVHGDTNRLQLKLTLVGSFLQLFIVGSLLDDVENRVGQLGIGQWVGLRVHSLTHCSRITG